MCLALIRFFLLVFAEWFIFYIRFREICAHIASLAFHARNLRSLTLLWIHLQQFLQNVLHAFPSLHIAIIRTSVKPTYTPCVASPLSLLWIMVIEHALQPLLFGCSPSVGVDPAAATIPEESPGLFSRLIKSVGLFYLGEHHTISCTSLSPLSEDKGSQYLTSKQGPTRPNLAIYDSRARDGWISHSADERYSNMTFISSWEMYLACHYWIVWPNKQSTDAQKISLAHNSTINTPKQRLSSAASHANSPK